jgi:hypothetical protein
MQTQTDPDPRSIGNKGFPVNLVILGTGKTLFFGGKSLHLAAVPSYRHPTLSEFWF